MDMWDYVLTWFTPPSLFIFLNLTIGTIIISHRFQKPPHEQENQPHPSLLQRVRSLDFSYYNSQPHHPDDPTGIVRTPSLLDRVRSFNYSFQQPEHVIEDIAQDQPAGIVRTPSLLDRVRSFKHSFQQPEHVTEDTTPDRPTEIVRTPSLMARLKSMDFSSLYRSDQESNDLHMVHRSKSDKGHEESRPEKVIKKTVSERGFEENDGGSGRPRRVVEKTMSFGDDEEVDAKADDFINRFKQQLKLQRLDSLLRYKEMLKGN